MKPDRPPSKSKPWIPRFPPGLAYAILIGIVCGLLDALAIQSKLLTTDRIDYVPQRVWLVCPALWTALCLVVAAVMVRRLRPFFVAAVFLAGPGLLLLIRLVISIRVIKPAWGLLGALTIWLVVITPLVILIQRNRGRILDWSRSAGSIAASALAATTVVISSCSGSAGAAAPAPGGASPPNVVLIFLDTVRYDASGLSAESSHLAPNLSQFAEDALVFDNAYAPSSWTLPSHFSVMTGLGAEHLEIDFNQQRYHGSRRTLAEWFRSRGYSTAAVLANPYLNPGTGFARGFDRFVYSMNDLDVCRSGIGFLLKLIPSARVPICRLTAQDVTSQALKTIAGTKQPYFLVLNYLDAHLPYWTPRSYRPRGYKPFAPFSEYPVIDRAMRLDEPVPPPTLSRLKANYQVAIRYLDDSLGELMSGLDPSNTLIVVVSDHGEQFGEHHLVLHGNSVYRQALHVPLVLKGPGIDPGRITRPVSIQQLYGTLLEGMGVSRHQSEPLPRVDSSGNDRPLLALYRAPRGFRGVPERLSVDVWSVIYGDLHFLRSATGREELYRYRSDPEEARDLASDPALAQIRAELSAFVQPFMERRSPTPDERRRFFSLGYIQ